MKIYATRPLGFWQLLQCCFVAYPVVLKKIWYLLIAIFSLIVVPILIVFLNEYIGIALLILSLLLFIYLNAVALYISHDALLGESIKLPVAMKVAKKRYLFLLEGIVLFLAIMMLAITIDFGIFAFGDWLGLHISAFVAAFVFATFSGLLFYFALPLIILEKKGILKSFETSAQLFLANGWRIVGIFIIIHVITFLFTLLGIILLHRQDGTYLYLVYSFVLQFFIYPLIISTILILMHDAIFRFKSAE